MSERLCACGRMAEPHWKDCEECYRAKMQPLLDRHGYRVERGGVEPDPGSACGPGCGWCGRCT